jgi:shikimate dehydrogenase
MKQLAIIGYPVGHSLSPVMYNAAFPAMAIDATFELWPTPLADLPDAIKRLRGPDVVGVCVTVPHKQNVMPLLEAIDPAAKAIGAVNCIVKGQDGRLTGHNTDKYGFVRSLREAGCEPQGMNVLVLGSGGSALAVGYGLAEAGVAAITVAGRTPANVAATVEHLLASTPRPLPIEPAGWHDTPFDTAAARADLIVNCTPIGMRHTAAEDDSPLRDDHLRPEVWVYDLVYNPLETALLRQAAKFGARPVGGLEMLIYQAVGCIDNWLHIEAPVDIMRRAARVALEARE